MASMDMVKFIRDYKDHLGEEASGPITAAEFNALTKMFCAMHTPPKEDPGETIND